MKGLFSAAIRNAEIAGLVVGLLMGAYWPLVKLDQMTPGWALLTLSVLAGVAGMLVGAVAAFNGLPSPLAVRRGAQAGAWATLTAAAVLVLMNALLPGYGQRFMAQIVAGASLMPAMLAGAIASGLGMLYFRRRVSDEVKLPQPSELPKAVRWGLRSLIFTAMLAALVSPFFPQQWAAPPAVAASPIHERPLSPPTFSEPEKAVISARPPFRYEVPVSLQSAPPVSWKVETSRDLGPLDVTHGLAFSKDGRYLATADDHTLIVQDLHTDKIRRVSSLPAPVTNLGFDPVGERLFVVMRGDPRRVAVAELDAGKFIPLPQPKKYAVPDMPFIWWKAKSILFLSKETPPLALDLDTLEFDPAPLSQEDQNRWLGEISGGMPANENWAFQSGARMTFAELPEVEGTNEWRWKEVPALVLSDLKRVSTKLFLDVDFSGSDTFWGVPDGSKLLRLRNGNGTVYYFTSGPVPPLRWTITIPHGPDRMQLSYQAREDFAAGRLSLVLYSPLVNPLNNRTVGPDRERPKAILRLRKWVGTEAEVWVESGSYPWTAGDVFADLYMPGSPPSLLSFDQPYRWWINAPEPEPDASDPAKLPLRTDFSQPKPKPKIVPVEHQPPPTTVPEPPLAGTDPKRADRIKKEIPALIHDHHQAAYDGRINDVVNHYANRVDYLEKGIVDRDYIRKDGIEYRRHYRILAQTGQGTARMKVLSPTTVQATYELVTEWQRLSDNLRGGGTFEVVMVLEEQPEGGWKIVSQRTRKIK